MKTKLILNKETAMRLWTAQFGATAKATDFAGREIAKAAYNDRKSRFGWNVDHILPESRGGKTVDYNLICCHIATNDEKADKFPCFTANEKIFEIQKRQNHYEIIDKKPSRHAVKDVNFFDAAQGLAYFQAHTVDAVSIGYVKIKITPITPKSSLIQIPYNVANPQRYWEENSGFDEFIEHYAALLQKIFKNKSITAYSSGIFSQGYIFTITAAFGDDRNSMKNLLHDCVLLNSYSDYFINHEMCDSICIICGIDSYEDLEDYAKNHFQKREDRFPYDFPLAIDSYVMENLCSDEYLTDRKTGRYPIYFYEYDAVFTKLESDLEKQ